MVSVVKTNQPILRDRIKTMQMVATFWDKISTGWFEIWGPHIHHGYYHDEQVTPLEAQEKLIVELAKLINISPGNKVLDIGCGMGGSAIFLAENFKVRVSGITLSNKQVEMAKQFAEKKNIDQVDFFIEDALSLAHFKDNTFDIAWSLESCEQFYDKEQFIKQVHRKLKTGGKLMLATWCADKDQYETSIAKKYKKICHAFDLPYMPTMKHYHQLLSKHGFEIIHEYDWSNQVKKSWDIGISLLNAYSFLKIFATSGWRGIRFAKQVKLMRDAFEEGWIQYGVFTAIKSRNS